jgi:hypothetical protein
MVREFWVAGVHHLQEGLQQRSQQEHLLHFILHDLEACCRQSTSELKNTDQWGRKEDLHDLREAGFKHIYTRRSKKKEEKKKKLHKQEPATKDRHRQAEVTHTRSNSGSFSFLRTTLGISFARMGKFYSFKMNASWKSRKFFTPNFSLCILSLESKIQNEDNKNKGCKKQNNAFVTNLFIT